jgi:hypothetical protein
MPHRGFSLIELLLVVIGVVGVLLPALTVARRHAQTDRAGCWLAPKQNPERSRLYERRMRRSSTKDSNQVSGVDRIAHERADVGGLVAAVECSGGAARESRLGGRLALPSSPRDSSGVHRLQ